MEDQISKIKQKYEVALAQIKLEQQEKYEALDKCNELDQQLKQQYFEHEQDLQNCQIQINLLKQENLELQSQSVYFNDDNYLQDDKQIEQQKKEIYELEKKVIQTEKHNEYIRTELEEQRDQVDQMQKHLRVLEKTKKKAMEESQLAKKQLRKTQQEIAKMKEEYSKYYQEMGERELDERARLQEYRKILTRTSQQAQDILELQKVNKSLQDQVNSKNQRLTVLRQQIKQQEKKIKDLQENEQKLQYQVSEFQEKFQEYSKIASISDDNSQIALDVKLTQSEQRLNNLLQKLEPLIKRNKELEKLVAHRDFKIAKQKEVIKQLNSTISQKNKQLKDFYIDINSPILTQPKKPYDSTIQYKKVRDKARQYFQQRNDNTPSPHIESIYDTAARHASKQFIYSSDDSFAQIQNMSPMAINLNVINQIEQGTPGSELDDYLGD